MTVKCDAPVAKFRDYIFKPGATHGKDQVFVSLGYNRADSEALATLYEQQAAVKYGQNDFKVGRSDQYGQRIDIEIELKSVTLTASGGIVEKVSYLRTGWMVQPDGVLHLNTPFSGFTR